MPDQHALPADDQRLAFVGTSGAGKTYAAKCMVELVVRAGHRVCVVDPLGVWWGLRAGRDGAAAGGLPVLILGGDHADVPLGEDDGGAVGRLIGAGAVQCVVDVSALPSKAARIRFMRAFLEALYDANREPLHLVLDEADLWAPQRPQPEQAVLQSRVGDIVRRGRVRGFVPWFITQRPAVLDKDVLSQADGLVAMKLTSSQDRAAIGAWIEGQADRAEAKRILADLPTLTTGEAWLWLPAMGRLDRMRFPAITTYDSSRTPKRGERALGTALAKVDAAAFVAALAAGGSAERPNSPTSPNDRTAAFAKGLAAGRAEAAAEIAQLQGAIADLRARMDAAAGHLMAERNGEQPLTVPPDPVRTIDHAPAAKTPDKRGRTAPVRREPQPDKLHAAGRAILAVLAPRAPAGLTWRQISTLAGRANRGGHWETGRRALRDAGFVTETDGVVVATPAGVAQAGAIAPPPTDAAARLALWASKLPGAGAKLLHGLANAPGPIAWSDLAEQVGLQPRGGHYETGRRALKDNELVIEEGGCVRLVPELLPKAPGQRDG